MPNSSVLDDNLTIYLDTLIEDNTLEEIIDHIYKKYSDYNPYNQTNFIKDQINETIQ
jgi:hypothetical protein